MKWISAPSRWREVYLDIIDAFEFFELDRFSSTEEALEPSR
jgi:hypothetical protein